MSNSKPDDKHGAGAGKPGTPAPPDVSSDRAAPAKPGAPADKPLPIADIEDEEDDALGG